MTAQLYRISDYRRRDFLDDWFAGMELVGQAQIAVMLGWAALTKLCFDNFNPGSPRAPHHVRRAAPPGKRDDKLRLAGVEHSLIATHASGGPRTIDGRIDRELQIVEPISTRPIPGHPVNAASVAFDYHVDCELTMQAIKRPVDRIRVGPISAAADEDAHGDPKILPRPEG